MSIDLETRSACDLPKAGAAAYARHPTTDVLVACYAFDDEEPRTWIRGEPVPADLANYVLNSDGPIWAFNAMFEHNLWEQVLGPKYGWPVPALERWHCTAAMAACMALPRRLGDVVKALGMEEEKDDTGRRIMMQVSRPRSKPGEAIRWWEPEDVPEKFDRLYKYCANDVVIERGAAARMRPLSPGEREIWLENCRVNERGLPIDIESVHHALAIVGKCTEALNREVAIITRNAVTTISQVARMTEWLSGQGVDVDSLDKAHLAEALSRELPHNVRRVLEIRQEAAKSSTAKLKAILACVCEDGRIRGTMRYHGASTGRDAGELVQPQNLPRPQFKQKAIDAIFATLPSRDPAWLELWGPAMSVIASCLRGMIRAEEGKLLFVGDLANIEGRVAAWLAGEQWKLDAFAAYDAKTGPDLYKVAAAGVFGITPEDIDDDDDRRQVGKVVELSLQFQGGHGAFITMAANYGVTPEQVAPIVRASVPADLWDAAEAKFQEDNRFSLPCDQWTALRVVVDAWRARHPKIVQMWADCEEAAIAAVQNPGKRYTVGRLSYACAGGILWCRLPNGKLLSFVDPKLADIETPWGSKKRGLTYMTLNSVTRRYERTKSYGGLIFQNGVQATAREIIMAAKMRFKARGWGVILKVHDELDCELGAGVTAEEYNAELSIVPDWAVGLPVAAKTSVGRRYGK
jgi:DNA polymerase